MGSEFRVLISQKYEASRLGKPYRPLPEVWGRGGEGEVWGKGGEGGEVAGGGGEGDGGGGVGDRDEVFVVEF